MYALFYGGQSGIRTLERVLAVTRFPIVRLRPAQPTVHFRNITDALPYRLDYYITIDPLCQALFKIFFDIYGFIQI